MLKVLRVSTTDGYKDITIADNSTEIKKILPLTGITVRDGYSPFIDENTLTWWEWDTSKSDFVDTNIFAQGPQGIQGIQGEKGDAYVITDYDYDTIASNVYETYHEQLKGDTGEQGEKGDTYTITDEDYKEISDVVYASYHDVLKGEKGDRGAIGPKGEPGYTPQKGVDYFDGVSVTHAWDDTYLTIKSASGISSANLQGPQGIQGEKGEPGYTPIKGIDYFDGSSYEITRNDYDEIASAVYQNYGSVLKGEQGEQGIPATHSWNGTTLTVTSASGTSSANLKGEKGDTYTITESDYDDIAEVAKGKLDDWKQGIENELSSIPKFDISVVQSLPESGETATIYLLPNDEEAEGDLYTEYLWADGKWEILGSAHIDLSNYVTTSDYATESVAGVVKTNKSIGVDISSSGSLRGSVRTADQYDAANGVLIISKGTLENIKEDLVKSVGDDVYQEKGDYLTEHQSLEDYVKNTDWASGEKGGVVKIDSGAGVGIGSGGTLRSVSRTKAQYDAGSDLMFISKGTLENIKESLVTSVGDSKYLTEHQSLDGYVKNTDYANSATGGVFKTSNSYGTSMTAAGVLTGYERTAEQYASDKNNLIIAKGTLETVLASKGYLTEHQSLDDVVHISEQILTDAQKAQVKTNIDASRITDQVITRTWTKANFTTYATQGREETWTLNKKEGVIVGDIFTIKVTISDAANTIGYILIQVTQVANVEGQANNVKGKTLFATTQNYLSSADIPTKTSDLTNDSDFITLDDIPTVPTSGYLVRITYGTTPASEIKAILDAGNTPYIIYGNNTYYYQDISPDSYYRFVSVTPGSSATNDPPIIKRIYKKTETESGNWGTGNITLYDSLHKPTASDIGALPSTTKIPTNTSDLTNDSGFAEIFYAEYGETKFEEITNAYTAGKLILCNYANRQYMYSGLYDGTHQFTAVIVDRAHRINCKTNDTWGSSNYIIGISSNIPTEETIKGYINAEYVKSLIDDGTEVSY